MEKFHTELAKVTGLLKYNKHGSNFVWMKKIASFNNFAAKNGGFKAWSHSVSNAKLLAGPCITFFYTRKNAQVVTSLQTSCYKSVHKLSTI